MEQSVAKKIIDLNQEFYQTFAQPFAATRQRLQPGVRSILEQLSSPNNLLDLGCGNGELYRNLHAKGFPGKYLGLDFSRDLLEVASQDKTNQVLVTSAQKVESLLANPSSIGIFYQADLTKPDWDIHLPQEFFETVCAFAVLHHIPSQELREQILSKVHKLLKPGGIFWHSEWQFMNSPRLTARIQPWNQVALDESLLDPGDYLLDWRQGGQGLRYVHLFNLQELSRLAEENRFEIIETFFSDGKENKLALYQKWKAL